MYVIISKYLDYENQNILAICQNKNEAHDIINYHFNRNYSRHLTLEINNDIGYVSGYSTSDTPSEEYYIVEPYMEG